MQTSLPQTVDSNTGPVSSTGMTTSSLTESRGPGQAPDMTQNTDTTTSNPASNPNPGAPAIPSATPDPMSTPAPTQASSTSTTQAQGSDSSGFPDLNRMWQNNFGTGSQSGALPAQQNNFNNNSSSFDMGMMNQSSAPMVNQSNNDNSTNQTIMGGSSMAPAQANFQNDQQTGSQDFNSNGMGSQFMGGSSYNLQNQNQSFTGGAATGSYSSSQPQGDAFSQNLPPSHGMSQIAGMSQTPGMNQPSGMSQSSGMQSAPGGMPLSQTHMPGPGHQSGSHAILHGSTPPAHSPFVQDQSRGQVPSMSQSRPMSRDPLQGQNMPLNLGQALNQGQSMHQSQSQPRVPTPLSQSMTPGQSQHHMSQPVNQNQPSAMNHMQPQHIGQSGGQSQFINQSPSQPISQSQYMKPGQLPHMTQANGSSLNGTGPNFPPFDSASRPSFPADEPVQGSSTPNSHPAPNFGFSSSSSSRTYGPPPTSSPFLPQITSSESVGFQSQSGGLMSSFSPPQSGYGMSTPKSLSSGYPDLPPSQSFQPKLSLSSSSSPAPPVNEKSHENRTYAHEGMNLSKDNSDTKHSSKSSSSKKSSKSSSSSSSSKRPSSQSGSSKKSSAKPSLPKPSGSAPSLHPSASPHLHLPGMPDFGKMDQPVNSSLPNFPVLNSDLDSHDSPPKMPPMSHAAQLGGRPDLGSAISSLSSEMGMSGSAFQPPSAAQTSFRLDGAGGIPGHSFPSSMSAFNPSPLAVPQPGYGSYGAFGGYGASAAFGSPPGMMSHTPQSMMGYPQTPLGYPNISSLMMGAAPSAASSAMSSSMWPMMPPSVMGASYGYPSHSPSMASLGFSPAPGMDTTGFGHLGQPPNDT